MPRASTSHPNPNRRLAPATTPDIQVSSLPPPFADLSAALARTAFLRRHSSPSHRRSLLAEEDYVEDPDPDEDDQGEEEEEGGEGEGQVNVGMLRCGWTMLIGSFACFVLGLWSIAVGPFLDTKDVWVSCLPLSSRARAGERS